MQFDIFWQRRGRDVLLNSALLFLFTLSVLPLAICFNLSLKTVSQFEHERWLIKGPFQFGNYAEAWDIVSTYIMNSVVVSGAAVVGVVVLSAMGGFAFARGRFPFKEPLFLLILSGLMVPGLLYLVPKYILYRDFGLINTRWALILAYWTEGQIFGIFLFRSYMESLPDGLFDAAEIDGANIWGAFRHVAVPLSKPIIGTLAVINIMFTWNDIIWPWLVIGEDQLRTISIGMSVFQREFSENWGPMFAGFLLASIPLVVLFVFASRYFIEGLTSGAFKA